MKTTENQSHYKLPHGAGLINPEIIPPHPHPNFCSSSYYTPLSDVVCDHRDEIPEDRTVASLRKHKEDEKRCLTRINSTLDKLHRILHCNPKMDKTTLLAMVVQRMRELKWQTSDITALGIFPSESDGVSFLSCDDCYYKEHLRSDQGIMFKALLYCEDRSNHLPSDRGAEFSPS